MVTPAHPAVYSKPLLPIFAEIIVDEFRNRRRPIRVLDPFAGVGTIHELATLCSLPGPPGASMLVETVGVELMPAWVAAHERTQVGDATDLPAEWTGTFDAVVTSPCYGNRMADHHEARDKCKACRGNGWVRLIDLSGEHVRDTGRDETCSKCKGSGLSHRRSYRHYYGDKFWSDADRLSNAGAMAFGPAYQALHEDAWIEARRVLLRDGLLILNVKNHERQKKVVDVAGWHRRTIERVGFERLRTITVPLRGYRYGANREARALAERVYVFRKVAR